MSLCPKGPNNLNQNGPNAHFYNGKIYKRFILICEFRTRNDEYKQEPFCSKVEELKLALLTPLRKTS